MSEWTAADTTRAERLVRDSRQHGVLLYEANECMKLLPRAVAEIERLQAENATYLNALNSIGSIAECFVVRAWAQSETTRCAAIDDAARASEEEK